MTLSPRESWGLQGGPSQSLSPCWEVAGEGEREGLCHSHKPLPLRTFPLQPACISLQHWASTHWAASHCPGCSRPAPAPPLNWSPARVSTCPFAKQYHEGLVCGCSTDGQFLQLHQGGGPAGGLSPLNLLPSPLPSLCKRRQV